MTRQSTRSTGWIASTRAEAEQGIANSLREAYPGPKQADAVIRETQKIYRANFFPEMKTDWRVHPNFVGHKDWNGCFRCHDGQHTATDGQKAINGTDCRACHLILAQGSGGKLNEINPKGHEFFHVDSEYSEFSCADCHTGGIQK
jgi:hypothetical protein